MMYDRKNITIKTPFGPIEVTFTEEAVIGVRWLVEKADTGAFSRKRPEGPMASRIEQEFSEFWEGYRKDLTLPYIFTDSTPFLIRIWETIKKIPYGTTMSYGQIAQMVGENKSFARAVGRACARNPLPLIIPCHRVIKSNGSIGEYSAPGGSRLKSNLITFEKNNLRKELIKGGD